MSQAPPRRPENVGLYESRTPLAWGALMARIFGVLVEAATYAHHHLRRRERFLSEPDRKLAWDLLRYAKGAISSFGQYASAQAASSVSPSGHLPIHTSAAPPSGPDASGEE